jgi:hypothetical protein
VPVREPLASTFDPINLPMAGTPEQFPHSLPDVDPYPIVHPLFCGKSMEEIQLREGQVKRDEYAYRMAEVARRRQEEARLREERVKTGYFANRLAELAGKGSIERRKSKERRICQSAR